LVYLLIFHAYINEMHSSRSKILSKNLVHVYIYIYTYVKFLALLEAPCIYNISRLTFNRSSVLNTVLEIPRFLNLSILTSYVRRTFLINPLNPSAQRCVTRFFIRNVASLNRAFRAHHVTRHNAPIHDILSTAPQLIVPQKALGTLRDDCNVMPKHVGATIHN
jgi:hypothetical protein